MGKTSITSLNLDSRKSKHTSKHKKKMNNSKSGKRKRNLRQKTRSRIKLLFDKLRNESSQTSNIQNETVIHLDDTLTPVKSKRKLSCENNNEEAKKSKHNDTLIVIQDDNEEVSSTPYGTPNQTQKCSAVSSTPKPNTTAHECNISKISNNRTQSQEFNEDVAQITKDINQSSYLTIDLTKETQNNTVIDLSNVSDAQECSFVSASSASLSGESDVTVLNMSKHNKRKDKDIKKFADGISRLNASDKGRLLELITQKIFTGCQVPDSVRNTIAAAKGVQTDTAEDTFIREVILGEVPSRNSVGSNIYNPQRELRMKTGLRMIVIDGSNVAMEHSMGRVFSVKGLKICIDYFVKRGHVVKAFVPRFRCKFGKSSDPRLLDSLERAALVVYTPSRELHGRLITPYDDRYIVQCAAEFDGVIVSGDNYRDLVHENPKWRFVIENRLLQFTWVDDLIMFPKDPLGRNGPTLEEFLRYPTQPTITIK